MTAERTDQPGDSSAGWQLTLWTMVAVQVVMSISFSIVSPIMPLFLPELGVTSIQAIDLWAGVIASITSFIAIFTAPVWGSLADRWLPQRDVTILAGGGGGQRHPARL